MSTIGLAREIIQLLDEIALKAAEPPSEGYTAREISLSVWDTCADGGESVLVWEIDLEDIAEMRAALMTKATP